MKFIYLASPYSHSDMAVMQMRFDKVCKRAAKLMQDGWSVFSPIAQSHPIAAYMDDKYRTDFEFWMKMDLPLLRFASELHVLTLEGWFESKGVTREIQFARTLGIHISYYGE